MLYYIMTAFILLGCTPQKNISCDYSQMKDENIWRINSSIKIPKQCILEDTLMFDRNTLMNHRYRSHGSSLLLFVYVNQDGDFPGEEKNFNYKSELQRNEIIFGTKTHQLIKDIAVIKNSIKVGYLKYVIEKSDGKFIASKIFFIRDKKVCVVDVYEKYKNEYQEKQSLADCMLESLKMN